MCPGADPVQPSPFEQHRQHTNNWGIVFVPVRGPRTRRVHAPARSAREQQSTAHGPCGQDPDGRSPASQLCRTTRRRSGISAGGAGSWLVLSGGSPRLCPLPGCTPSRTGRHRRREPTRPRGHGELTGRFGASSRTSRPSLKERQRWPGPAASRGSPGQMFIDAAGRSASSTAWAHGTESLHRDLSGRPGRARTGSNLVLRTVATTGISPNREYPIAYRARLVM